MVGNLKNIPPIRSDKTLGWPWNVEVDSSIYDAQEKWPTISVVIPSYNQGKFIEKTIRSVLLQNYPKLELIIMDGGSSDNTPELIKKYDTWIDYWVSQKDKGQSDAINKGLNRACGEILYWINSDDYLLPDALFHVGSFRWTPETGAIVGIGHKVDIQDQICYTPKVPELSFEAFLRWVGYGNFMQPACFFSAAAWHDCGPLNESLHFCLDVDLWLKISQKYKFEKLEHEIAHAYIHPDAKTTAEFDKMKIETALLITQYGGFEIARENLYQLWDKYAYARKVYDRLRQLKLFKTLKRSINFFKGTS